MSRKDSKGMFAAVLGQLGNDEVVTSKASAPRSSSPHLLKVAAGVRQMQERSDLADKLLKDGEQVVDLDPAVILPSTIPDRYESAYAAAAIAEIVESMRERGQIVPGLVRPSPTQRGAFQIVYGRRRLAAAKKLGIKFKAVVRELTDEQAVIFQGEENTGREDLSYIEKCSFAVAQQEAGYTRQTICASLSTGKSHVSEMIKIGSSIPKEILHSIGAAPGIGRGRWEELTLRYLVKGNAEKAAEFVRKGRFLEAGSDERFNLLFAFLPPERSAAKRAVVAEPTIQAWAPADRSVSATIKNTGTAFNLQLKSKDAGRFGAYISDNLDVFYDAFRKSLKSTGD